MTWSSFPLTLFTHPLIFILSAGSCRPCVPSPPPTPVSKRRKAHLRRLDRRWTLGGMVNRQHSRGDHGSRILPAAVASHLTSFSSHLTSLLPSSHLLSSLPLTSSSHLTSLYFLFTFPHFTTLSSPPLPPLTSIPLLILASPPFLSSPPHLSSSPPSQGPPPTAHLPDFSLACCSWGQGWREEGTEVAQEFIGG